MQNLLDSLQKKHVQFHPNETVSGFEKQQGKITKVKTNKAVHDADLVVVAAGSWSRALTSMLQLRIPLVAGRGYSFTLKDSPYQLNYPAILTEGRVAITPFQNNLIRFGGTMEITSTNAKPNYTRVKGIIQAVKEFLPAFDIAMPEEKDIWFGYRPCSADGLPYIGRTRRSSNCIVATGHSMLGLSLGAATGKLVSELANEADLSMDIKAFDVDRFG
jgi:D-amino-acid dehydrogenase